MMSLLRTHVGARLTAVYLSEANRRYLHPVNLAGFDHLTRTGSSANISAKSRTFHC
jgi:hypothetical protein